MGSNPTPAPETNAKAGAPQVSWKREGFRTVTPYIVVDGAAKLMDFVRIVFGATERLRVPRPDGKIMHAEAQIGDSIIEMADGNAQYPSRPMPIHLYVRDADAAYGRALAAGATSLFPPADQEYGDRMSGMRDPLGNYWYIASRLGAEPIPTDLPNLMPYIHAAGAQGLIDFMKNAFGAVEKIKVADPNGRIAHAAMQIGDAVVELSEAQGDFQPMPGLLHVYVPDADAAYAKAIAAGATSLNPPADQSYGDRSANVKDPFGNLWTVATHKFDFVP